MDYESLPSSTSMQELCVLVLDVGPSMSDVAVNCAVDAVSTFIQSKMVDKVDHEVGLVAFGTPTTRNDLADECTAQSDVVDQYQNITTVIPIGIPMPPSIKALHHLAQTTRQPESYIQGSSNHISCDFVDALTVTLDHIAKEIAPGAAEVVQRFHRRRLVLISNFQSPVKPDPNGEFIEHLTQSWVSRSMGIEVLCIDDSVADRSSDSVKESNLALVRRMLRGLTQTGNSPPPLMKRIKDPALLAGSFPIKEYLPTHTLSSVVLSIGDTLKIPVKLATKTTKEKFPTLGKESPLIPPSGDTGDGGGIEISREWFRQDDVHRKHPIPEEERVVGYRYGKDVVPMSAEDLDLATFRPKGPPGLTVVGCVHASSIPRHALMSHALVMVSHKDVMPAKSALSALVRRLHARGQVLIIRRTRPRGALQFLVAYPVVGCTACAVNDDSYTVPSYQVDHFVCNVLPFREDIRSFFFSSFDRDDRRPTEDQYQAAIDLIDGMTVKGDDADSRTGGLVPNPTLHRFMAYVVGKALDQRAVKPDPEDDPLLRLVLRPRSADNEDVLRAARTFARSLGMDETTKKHQRLYQILHPAVHKVREEHAEEDFRAMMAQENYVDAMNGAARLVKALVGRSIHEEQRGSQQAVSLLLAMRAECLSRRYQVNLFNDHLESIFEALAATRLDFLRTAAQAGCVPITSEEAGGDAGWGVSAKEAEDFTTKYLQVNE